MARRRLPWRMRRYLAFVAGSGIGRSDHGHFVFRHEVLTDHLRGEGLVRKFAHHAPEKSQVRRLVGRGSPNLSQVTPQP